MRWEIGSQLEGRFVSLEAILEPKSIAILGASADHRKYTGKIQTALTRHGFAGDLIPINPKYDTLFGRPCYPSLEEAPPSDLVIVAVPSEGVLAALQTAAAKGARGALIVSAGFAETGSEGRAQQQRLHDFAAETGIRILGPNSQGAYKVGSGVCTSFATPFLVGDPIVSPGSLAWISQSGALGGAAVTSLLRQGHAIRYYFSTGNEADLTVSEIMSHVVEDEQVRVIGGYIEDIKGAETLARAMHRANTLGKRVIMIRGGGTEAGAEATRLHTGAFTQGVGVVEGFLRQCGIVVAKDLEELVAAVTEYRDNLEPVTGVRTAVLGNSGGLNTILADACHRNGFDLERPDGEFLAAIKENVPSFIVPGNPIDLAQAAGINPSVVGKLVRGVGKHVDRILICLYSVYESLGYDYEMLFGGLKEAIGEVDARVSLLLYGSDPAAARHARDAGLPLHQSMQAMLQAISACRNSAAYQVESQWVPVMVEGLAASPAGIIDEAQCKTMLGEAGIAVPERRIVKTALEALEAAHQIGYPVVAKLVTDEVVHKAAAGVLEVDLRDDGQLTVAFARLQEAADRVLSDRSSPATFLIEQKVDFDVEVMAGFKRVRMLGVMMLVGTGGSLVEVIGDVASAFCPLDRRRIADLIGQTRLRELEAGASLDALIETLARLQEFFLSRTDLLEMDINPIGFSFSRTEAVVLDAVGVRATYEHPRPKEE